jgi:hypothetical protein
MYERLSVQPSCEQLRLVPMAVYLLSHPISSNEQGMAYIDVYYPDILHSG